MARVHTSITANSQTPFYLNNVLVAVGILVEDFETKIDLVGVELHGIKWISYGPRGPRRQGGCRFQAFAPRRIDERH